MIDFHAHILPEIDDGPKLYEESVAILHEAKTAGFDKIISTSHYALNVYEIPEYKRQTIIQELKTEQDIPEIFLGSEIFLTHNIVDLLKEYKASTINGTNYVLLELSPKEKKITHVEDIIAKLKENNYIPILSHPERYILFQKNFKLLYELKDLGVLFQSNYGSILGMYGFFAKITMKKMLKSNLVNFLGSDVHKKRSIYTKTSKAIKEIGKIISSEYLENLTTTNAQKILNGESLLYDNN